MSSYNIKCETFHKTGMTMRLNNIQTSLSDFKLNKSRSNFFRTSLVLLVYDISMWLPLLSQMRNIVATSIAEERSC